MKQETPVAYRCAICQADFGRSAKILGAAVVVQFACPCGGRIEMIQGPLIRGAEFFSRADKEKKAKYITQ
jgi:DNA-directed RNA polymerase subunit RPC12/RpoP